MSRQKTEITRWKIGQLRWSSQGTERNTKKTQQSLQGLWGTLKPDGEKRAEGTLEDTMAKNLPNLMKIIIIIIIILTYSSMDST